MKSPRGFTLKTAFIMVLFGCAVHESAVAAQDESVVVLNATAVHRTATGMYEITLSSEVVITVWPHDLNSPATDKLLKVLSVKPVRSTIAAPTPAVASAPATRYTPQVTSGVGGIRSKCATDWPDDFSMRAFCERQQHESVGKLDSRDMSNGTYRIIRNKCAADWTDDFTMRDFCEEQQLKALRELK